MNSAKSKTAKGVVKGHDTQSKKKETAGFKQHTCVQASNTARSTTHKRVPTSTSMERDKSEPLFFFKPNEPQGEFCQWYPSTFTVSKITMSDLVGHPIDETDPEGWNNIYFNCAEQFMMYCKAGRFHDTETQREVMATHDPKEQKRLARLTVGFDPASWDEIKSDVVVAGNLAKFGQNPKLKGLLLQTGSRLLAEAASLDRVWGIGYTAQEALVFREKWGENRLGNALMKVRRMLQEEDLCIGRGE